MIFIVIGIWFAWGLISPHIWEQPAYKVVERFDKAEIRHYYPTKVIITEDSTDGNAFSKLASFIFGENREKEKIAMTAPVVSESGKKDPVKMMFFLPKKYNEEDIPTPKNDEILIQDLPAWNAGVIRFYGRMTEKKRKKYERKLLEILKQYNYEQINESFLMQYSDPFVPPPLRRNEFD
ncbi:MAG: heme-binding protein [Candidatus Lokiarchaeota archaeon]